MYSAVFPIIEDDAVVEIFCMDIDVTREKEARRELEQNLEHMRSFYDMMVGRESRMLDLKREINELCGRLGEARRYNI